MLIGGLTFYWAPLDITGMVFIKSLEQNKLKFDSHNILLYVCHDPIQLRRV